MHDLIIVRRFSAYDAYLVPALRRVNLEVATPAHATCVVIENGRAAGMIELGSAG